MSEEKTQKEEKATIIVKNVDQDIKETLKNIAETSGKAVSEVVREALKLYVAAKETGAQLVKGIATTTKQLVSEDLITIKNIGELSLSKEDIISFEKKIALVNIDKLEFADDVTPDLFKEKVEQIINVKELIVPKTLPKALILPKCSYVNKIIQR
ncbi:MAG: ribbon-helix-helix protein, CopG family [Thermoproteota archaeon]|jgi:predicted transcriptional regulator|nr:ribbon-helix-helix protein, CopG family [Thermoproteota archaeon]